MKKKTVKKARVDVVRLGARVDDIYKLKQKRYKLEADAQKIKVQEQTLEEQLGIELAKAKATGVRGTKAQASMRSHVRANIIDWTKFYADIRKKNAFDLLQRRVNDAAYVERLERNEKIAGAEPFKFYKLSVTKLGSSGELKL